MPVLEQSSLWQTALLWVATGYDEYGQPTVSSTYTEISVRWENKRGRVQDPQGNTIALDAMVCVGQEITVGSLLWLGVAQEWSGTGSGDPNTDLMEVKTSEAIPDIKCRETEYELGLVKYKGRLPG